MTTKQSKPSLVELVTEYIAHADGSEGFHRHPLARKLIYTDGIKFVADTLGAHWFVDAIASYVATSEAVRREDFQVWTLTAPASERDGARLVCDDGNGREIIAQEIPYTDFPRELMPFGVYCEASELEPGVTGFVLMLKGER